jgi:hypothetical protein
MPADLNTVLDYQDMTAMLAPRPALLILNERDECCFRTDRTRAVIYDAVLPTYRAFGAEDRFEFHSNQDPGTHNYGEDNRRQFYRFLKKHFRLPAQTPDGDIHRPEELYTEQALDVGLPPEQETFITIAIKRGRELCAEDRTPRTAAQKAAMRKRIAGAIRLPSFALRSRKHAGAAGPAVYELELGPWTVPAVVSLSAAASGSTVVKLHDGGRAALDGMPPKPGESVVAADIFGTGENVLPHLMALIVESVGQRVLGIQVAQTLAVTDFARRLTGAKRVEAWTSGRMAGFAALVAAALRPELFSRVSICWEVMSLRYLAEWPIKHQDAVSVFCPDLLTVADVPDMLRLMEGVEFDPYGRSVPTGVIG